MKHARILIAAAVPMLALAGCATDSMDISAGNAPGGSMAGLTTYSWSADAGSSISDPKIQDPSALDRKVRATVDSALASRGYASATGSPGDFLVDYQVSVQDTTSSNLSTQDRFTNDAALSGGGGYGYRATENLEGLRGAPTTNIIRRGSILVEIKDPTTGKLIWRGNAHTNVNPDAPEVTRQVKVQKAVEGIMSKFPAAG